MSREFPTTEEEFELSLELSIGGCYAKSETQILEGETATPSDGGGGEVSRSDFSCEKTHQIDAAENAPEFSDLRRRREMQAMKRREARMKRDFKKSRGVNGGDGGGGDRVVLEFHGGVERREREGIPEEEESARKREKKSNAPPLFGENKVSWGGDYGAAAQFLLPAVGNGYACPLVVPVWGSNAAAGERDGRNSGEVTPENVAAAAAAAASSSAVYHHRSTSQKGGSSSDTGSHSSSFGTHQSDKVEHLEVNNSSQTEPGRGIVASSSNIQQQQQEAETSKTVEGSTMRAHSNLTDTSCSMVEKPSSSHTSSVTDTPPKLTNSGQDSVASALRMPFVSTTGNGPNGRTITGFLHKYSKSEVSIMCVCHGSFFSPAGFVEHAGGVNITHPLRHITVVPSILR